MSDGILDNLYTKQIIEILEKYVGIETVTRNVSKEIAKEIAEEAFTFSRNGSYWSPFA